MLELGHRAFSVQTPVLSGGGTMAAPHIRNRRRDFGDGLRARNKAPAGLFSAADAVSVGR
jgi:hypothetical protein